MMVLLAAWWGLGYAAIMVATVASGWYTVRKEKTVGITGHIFSIIGVLLLGIGLLSRALKGHGWPFVSPSDTALGIAWLMLALYAIWGAIVGEYGVGLMAGLIALPLLSVGLSQQITAPVTEPLSSLETILSELSNIAGGALLAFVAAIGLCSLARPWFSEWHWLAAETSTTITETMVRWALFFLATSLAINVWWIQKLELGVDNDAQQAGTAIAWMIYFIVLRLYSHTRQRGWPWAAILVAGFICTLPILLDVPWLETPLAIW